MANHTQPAPKRRTGRKILLGTLGVFVLLVVVIGVSGGGDTKDTAAPSTTAPISAAPFVPPTYVQPAPVAAPMVVEPVGTTAQRNAADKAESYLAYAAFSRTGLVKQLEFEGFSTTDATYAVDHITVDWTEQADKKAQSYMSYSSFSRGGLIKQLEFEGFTKDQAAHGATSVGL